MNRSGPSGLWVVALGLISLTSVSLAANAGGSSRDKVWTHPEMDRLRPKEIALLPIVSFADDVHATRYLQDRWMRAFQTSGYRWRSATDCSERMAAASRGHEPLQSTLAHQVRATGDVDSATAASLCRVVGSPSIMMVRIDRWERVDGVAEIDLRATLMDSLGRTLWRCSSGTSAGKRGSGGYAEVSPSSVHSEWVGSSEKQPPPGYDPPSNAASPAAASEDPSAGAVAGVERDFAEATGKLLARWAPLLSRAPAAGAATGP